MKTIVLISTQTSATGSICRIINRMTQDTDIVFLGLESSKKEIIGNNFNNIPKKNHIVLHNRPDLLRHIKNPEDYRYIINFRDPRDRLCNSFYWMQQHPLYPGESQEEIKKRAVETRNKGINEWVIENSRPQYELSLINFLRTLTNVDKQVATYADLCLNFDKFVYKLSSFINIRITDEIKKDLEPERCDNLVNNKNWIGARWEGADILPGRYKRELDERSIKKLNSIYHEVLSQMAILDSDNKNLYYDQVIESEYDIFSKLPPKSEPAEILRDVALAFENIGDISTAVKIMEKAKLMRPKGPLINAKIKKYSHFLNNN